MFWVSILLLIVIKVSIEENYAPLNEWSPKIHDDLKEWIEKVYSNQSDKRAEESADVVHVFGQSHDNAEHEVNVSQVSNPDKLLNVLKRLEHLINGNIVKSPTQSIHTSFEPIVRGSMLELPVNFTSVQRLGTADKKQWGFSFIHFCREASKLVEYHKHVKIDAYRKSTLPVSILEKGAFNKNFTTAGHLFGNKHQFTKQTHNATVSGRQFLTSNQSMLKPDTAYRIFTKTKVTPVVDGNYYLIKFKTNQSEALHCLGMDSSGGLQVTSSRCLFFSAHYPGLQVRGGVLPAVSLECACSPGYYINRDSSRITIRKRIINPNYDIDSTFYFKPVHGENAFQLLGNHLRQVVCKSSTDVQRLVLHPLGSHFNNDGCKVVLHPIAPGENPIQNCQWNTNKKQEFCISLNLINSAEREIKLKSSIKTSEYIIKGREFRLTTYIHHPQDHPKVLFTAREDSNEVFVLLNGSRQLNIPITRDCTEFTRVIITTKPQNSYYFYLVNHLGIPLHLKANSSDDGTEPLRSPKMKVHVQRSGEGWIMKAEPADKKRSGVTVEDDDDYEPGYQEYSGTTRPAVHELSKSIQADAEHELSKSIQADAVHELSKSIQADAVNDSSQALHLMFDLVDPNGHSDPVFGNDPKIHFKAVNHGKTFHIRESPHQVTDMLSRNLSGVTLKKFDNIPGDRIKNLIDSNNYPYFPSSSLIISHFSEPEDWGDHYGSSIEGFFVPQQDGNHVFHLASGKEGKLYLGSDFDPKSKRLIAHVQESTSPMRQSELTGVKSDPIDLIAGVPYYILALHKESTGPDHLSVGMTTPDGQVDAPISVQYLYRLPVTKINSTTLRHLAEKKAKEIAEKTIHEQLTRLRMTNKPPFSLLYQSQHEFVSFLADTEVIVEIAEKVRMRFTKGTSVKVRRDTLIKQLEDLVILDLTSGSAFAAFIVREWRIDLTVKEFERNRMPAGYMCLQATNTFNSGPLTCLPPCYIPCPTATATPSTTATTPAKTTSATTKPDEVLCPTSPSPVTCPPCPASSGCLVAAATGNLTVTLVPPSCPPCPPPVICPKAPKSTPQSMCPPGHLEVHAGNSPPGSCCKFPFVYKGITMHRCTREEKNFRWCATTQDYDKDKKWGFCPQCFIGSGGTSSGYCCHFPFVFGGKLHATCVNDTKGKPWCSVTYNLDLDGLWTYCPVNAPGSSSLGTLTQPPCPEQCKDLCSDLCPDVCCNLPDMRIKDPSPEVPGCPASCQSWCGPPCPSTCCVNTSLQPFDIPGYTSYTGTGRTRLPIGPVLPWQRIRRISPICPPLCKRSCKKSCPVTCCSLAS
ncbi:uncharacterized protein LOC116607202 isoform X2 [Nematostella vectensis]|uniref:uncharacterized protein LOC116607202 isoform X2 n=1 Tax=Nematostella vectensis TaxID=45351 RepID=UPI002076FE96|nr:uncharacterized protein LOC116607202 isoform X2 [Nematostella vectensis]